MRHLKLPDYSELPVLGLGTWYMGERSSQFESEVAAVRHAIDRGIRLIDTAEMYANGGAEEVIGEAIRRTNGVSREELKIVSKVLPSHASYDGTIRACENSLKRMNTDYIDIYLLHWRGSVPFSETLRAFSDLRSSGKIRSFGVSNFDADDLTEWCNDAGDRNTATNQILYNLSRRGVEWDLLPICEKSAIPVMAYSPLEQGRLADEPVLAELAKKHGVSPLQIALAWVLARPNIVAIPKAVDPQHIDQNIAALNIELDEQDHALLDAAFPPPRGPSHLEML